MSAIDAYRAADALTAMNYPAYFVGLTGDALRAIEDAGDESAPADHIAGLLRVLADWKQRIDQLDAAFSSADVEDIVRQGPGTPGARAYRAVSLNTDAYLQAVTVTHAAWVDWSFRETVGVRTLSLAGARPGSLDRKATRLPDDSDPTINEALRQVREDKTRTLAGVR